MNDRNSSFLVVVALITACSAGHAPPEPSAEAASATPTIEILKRVAERSDVRVAPVAREHLARLINAPAEIVLDPDRTAHLSPLVEARVEKVVVKLGDRVNAGALLAVLRSVAVGESRASLTQAEVDLSLSRANLNRQAALRDAKIGAQRAYEEALAATQRAEAATQAARATSRLVGAYELRAPIAGTVIGRHATIGETVGRETVLFTIAELGQVWVVGQVYERDIGAVSMDAAATLALEAYPKRSWTGRLSYVAGTLEHETRTLPVRLSLDNPDGVLRPGLFGSLLIEAGDAIDALAVPTAAVQRIADKTFVFVRHTEDAEHVRFTAREVVLGRNAGTRVEVKSGVQLGEPIAVSGTFMLRGEMLRDSLAEED